MCISSKLAVCDISVCSKSQYTFYEDEARHYHLRFDSRMVMLWSGVGTAK